MTTMIIRRTASIATITALLAGGIAGTAQAAETGTTTKATGATFIDLGADSMKLSTYNPITGKRDIAPAGLMGLRTADGSIVSVYCIEEDVHVSTSVNAKGGYIPADWATYQSEASGWNANRDQIAWILANSYPQKPAMDIVTDAQAPNLGRTAGSVAAAGTQAAIWHLTDGLEYAWTGQSDAKAVYEYLLKGAATAGPDAAPAVVGFDTSAMTQKGSIVGPITLKNATSATLNTTVPSGYALTDASGKAVIGTIAAGQELYLSVPAGTDAGSLSLSFAATTTSLAQGSVWTNAWTGVNTQSLITAKNESAISISVSADFTWKPVTPEPTTPEPTTPTTPVTPEPQA